MSGITTTTEEIREILTEEREWAATQVVPSGRILTPEEFDDWLREHDAKVRAEERKLLDDEHVEGVAYADDVAEGYEGPVPDDYTRHYCEADGEDWPCAYARLADALREVKADAIREYVEVARENPHTYYWPPSGVLDDAEQWAEEIEKGTI